MSSLSPQFSVRDYRVPIRERADNRDCPREPLDATLYIYIAERALNEVPEAHLHDVGANVSSHKNRCVQLGHKRRPVPNEGDRVPRRYQTC